MTPVISWPISLHQGLQGEVFDSNQDRTEDVVAMENKTEQNEQKFCSMMHPKLMPDSIGSGGIVFKRQDFGQSGPLDANESSMRKRCIKFILIFENLPTLATPVLARRLAA